MTDMPDLDILLDDVFRDLKTAVRSAFEVGRRYGRQEASEEMRAKLAAALNIDEPLAPTPIQEKTHSPTANAESTAFRTFIERASSQIARAPRGSVRPAVMRAIYNPVGATQTEVAKTTGINENSIRSTLNSLRNEGLARKDGDHWSLTEEGDKLVEPALVADQSNMNTEADDQDSGQVPSSASALEDFG